MDYCAENSNSKDEFKELILPEVQDALNMAVDYLQAGFVVAVPTDTVYGLVGSIAKQEYVDQIFDIKNRPKDVSIVVFVRDVSQAEEIAKIKYPEARNLMDKFWPGALTVVLDKRESLPISFGKDKTSVGIRVPKRKFVLDLIEEVGPLASTSANLHKMETPVDIKELNIRHDRLRLKIDGGKISGVPSTVVDCRSLPFSVLRQGEIKID